MYSCPPKKNPMYRYRETVMLGMTSHSQKEVQPGRVAEKPWPLCWLHLCWVGRATLSSVLQSGELRQHLHSLILQHLPCTICRPCNTLHLQQT